MKAQTDKPWFRVARLLADNASERPAIVRYGIAIAAVVLSALVSEFLSPIMAHPTAAFLFFLPAVLLAAWYGRVGPGLLAVLLGGLVAEWSFVEPRHQIRLGAAVDRVELAAFISVGLLIVGTVEAMHRARSHALIELGVRRQAEEQLRRAHDTFYHLIQNNPFGVYVVDADFRLRQVSLGAGKVFENVKPLLGRDFAEILRVVWDEPFATEAINRFRHTLETGEPFTSHSTVERRHDIDVVEAYDWRIERITLPDGRFGVVCYFYDLSERQRWEAALRESEERFKMATRATNDAIWDLDIARQVVWWNEGVQSLFGYSAAEVGHELDWWSERVHPEDRERVVASLHAVADGRENFWREEYRFRRRDGTYADVFDRGYVMRDAKGRAVRMIGAMQDLSERKQAEMALRDSKRNLAAANDQLFSRARQLDNLVEKRTGELREVVQQLETFSYSIVHDMRAPLRTMRSFAQILLDEYGNQLDPAGTNYLRRIVNAAGRMDALITDVLSYSRISTSRVEPVRVELSKVLGDIIEQYPQFQENAEAIHVEGTLPAVYGNPALLTQIFTNLISNALKFMPAGRQPNIVIRHEPRGPHARIWIEDNGIGIPAEHGEKIFGLFQRLHADTQYPGTGVGLAIVKKAVDRMGGSVGFESQPGEGSRFWIELPTPLPAAVPV